jgi:hypothetical protein
MFLKMKRINITPVLIVVGMNIIRILIVDWNVMKMPCLMNEVIDLVEWAAEECADGNETKGRKIYSVACRIYDRNTPGWSFSEHFDFEAAIRLKKIFNKYK